MLLLHLFYSFFALLLCNATQAHPGIIVYRHAHETVAEAEKGIADYLRYFNKERPHQELDNRTPDDVFFERKPLAKAA